jgi:hypothetical protein
MLEAYAYKRYAPVSCPNLWPMTTSTADIPWVTAVSVLVSPPYASIDIGGTPRGRVDADVVGYS